MKQLLFSIFVICGLQASLSAASVDDLSYEINGDSVIITDCDESASGELIIPGIIDFKPVTSIGSSAFRGCSSLTSVTIHDKITSIGVWAFYDCSSLTSIDVDTGNLFYSSIEGVLFNKLQTTLIKYPEPMTGAFTIPDSVTSIENYAFAYCSLTSVTIPDSVTRLGVSVFSLCSSLISVTIPDSVTSIGPTAFSGCSSLTSVTIPDSVTSINSFAFSGCSSLTSAIFEGDAPYSNNRNTIFTVVPSAFKVYFYTSATGFTEPTWGIYESEALALNEDNDGDHFPNELERLLGTSPLDENSRLKTWLSHHGVAGLQLNYGPHSDACEFIVESTTDLTDPDSWQPDEGLTFSAGSDSNELVADLPEDGLGAVFYRMQVSVIE